MVIKYIEGFFIYKIKIEIYKRTQMASYIGIYPVHLCKGGIYIMNIATYEDFNKQLYKDNDKGYVAVFRKGFKGVYTRSYRKQSLNAGLQGYFDNDYTTDLYCSMNTFVTPGRSNESLRYLNALYVDIDCYKLNMRKESVLYFLEHDYYNSLIPEPSLVVDSGRGLYLIWFIDRVPSQAVLLWRAVQKYLYTTLKEFGADAAALDPARVLRVIGSYNLKSNTTVKVLEQTDIRYSLKDIKEEYLPELVKKEPKPKKKTMGKKINFFTPHSLNIARMNDLLKLAELRQYDLVGRREIFLFLYRYYATLVEGADEAERLTFELNEKLISPLSLGELRATVSKYIGKYNYRNETLVELLEISKEEMKYMTSLISKEVKYEKNNENRKAKRRNEDGLTKRESQKREKMLLILKGINSGKNTKEISEEFSISIRIVQKYTKELKENDDLRNALQRLIVSDEDTIAKNDNLYMEIDEVMQEIAACIIPISDTGS